MGLMEKIFGDLNEKEVKKVSKIADKVMTYDEEMQALTDAQLREKTQEFKDRLGQGETLDDILPEAFAVCREAAWRSLGMKHFYVQVIGGIVLHQGRISEMKTGEGKTLVASAAGIPQCVGRKGRPRCHGKRLPGQERYGMDGKALHLPGTHGGMRHTRHIRGGKASRLSGRHNIRHQQ